MSHGGGSAGAGTSRARAYRSLALLLVLVAFIAWVAPAAVGQETIEAFLPADGAVQGWLRDGDLQKYAGDDLYTYIDGGAEIYQEYGFRRVVLQDYKDAAGKSISLEIFEMETPAAAYGIFTFKRSGKGKSVPLGSEAELEDYYLNLWKERFLVTLTGFDETPATIDGLMAVAGAVDSRIRDAADVPGLVSALPGKGLRPASVKYLAGLLGLNNIYPFYTARGLDFAAAVKGDYEDGSMLIVMDYGSAAARLKAWTELAAFLGGTDKFERIGAAGAGDPLFRDGKGRYAAFAPSGPRLRVGISPDPSAAIAIVGQSR
jgi:hypothetical protein